VLTNLSKSAQPDAQEALRNVRKALSMNMDVRILTTSGLDTTNEKLDSTDSLTLESALEGMDDPEENIVQVARQASGISVKGNPEDAMSQARPAVVLSENKSTRLRAARDKVAAIKPSMFQRILTATARRRASSGSQHRWSGSAMESTKAVNYMEPKQ
jgi:hypothetical protein